MNFKFTIALALLDLVASASVCPTAKTLAKDMEGLYRQDKTGVTEVIFGFYHQMQLDGFLLSRRYPLSDPFCSNLPY
ncbi:hypothetical protein K502DRAFT_353039 [Neoconidiobolus thromboides FSU 785]|nr:hypothetical protein K502DRAFT_353039 [Neoconidiobolus thromboides FSU 785]